MAFKTKEEILAAIVNHRYDDEFLLLLRSDILHPISRINSAASLLGEMMDDEKLDRETMRKLIHIIIQATEDFKTLIDEVVEYEEIQRKKSQNTRQEKPGDSN